MNWNYNEVVRSGNTTARVKNFYPDTGLVVLYDINGSAFEVGDVVIGDESGEELTVSEFNISYDYDMYYEPTYWQEILPIVVYDGNGKIVALDQHFTGKPSQDYQTRYLVVED